MVLKFLNQRALMPASMHSKIAGNSKFKRLELPVFIGLAIGVLSGCADSDEPFESAEPEFNTDGLAASMNLELSDALAALSGRQGTTDELAATEAFLKFVKRDGVIDEAERDIINELLALEPFDGLCYLYNGEPYTDLVAPSPEAKQLLGNVQDSYCRIC